MTSQSDSSSAAAIASQLVLAVPMNDEDEEEYYRQHSSSSSSFKKLQQTTSRRSVSSSSSATASLSFRLLSSICVSFPMYADKSQLQLQLFSNLIARSRKALLVGFDPLACYMRSLRSVNVENGRMASFFVDTMRPEAGIGARIELEKVNNSEGVTTTGGERSGISSQSVSRFAIVCAKEGAGFVKGVTLSRKQGV